MQGEGQRLVGGESMPGAERSGLCAGDIAGDQLPCSELVERELGSMFPGLAAPDGGWVVERG